MTGGLARIISSSLLCNLIIMVLEVSNNDSIYQSFIKIKVESRIEPYASYVNYEINIETNDPSFTFEKSSTRRRYSEFRTLRAMLVKQFRHINTPELPPKAPFKSAFDMDFVEQRRTKLEEFLAKLLSKKIFLSSRAFHLFLQSSCSMTEIKDIVTGKSNYVDVNWPGIVNESVSDLKDEVDKSSDEESSGSCSVPVTLFTTGYNSSPGCKRVSFCDQVTVAEIHTS
ncbi:Sorting nexin-11 [Araneus ventricosus]|uniref:Sorting nexin-11 n=1 Tax=Araneus ventricosus TaxID=182803 RepID=A0A4Y2G4U3_ARAVE|nr:Sorting nexin-11 [Araneus ventricosus]